MGEYLLNDFVYIVEITNKMQPCITVYYSTIYWRLNMFRAAYLSSSGALTVFAASGLNPHVVPGRSQVWVGIGLGILPVITDQVVTCVCMVSHTDARDYLINNRQDT